MAYVLIVSLSLGDDRERADNAIDNGTLIPFLRSHENDLYSTVQEEPED